MSINPEVKRILCYGASSTWGKKHTVNTRWTGILQNLLGNAFEVIEEGLPSRTTNIDDPEQPDRNGLTSFRPCIESHQPVHICIIWLGTNDFKERFNRSVSDIAEGVREVVQVAKQYVESNNIILISPAVIYDTEVSKEYGFSNVHEKSTMVGVEYQKVAEQENTALVDLQAEGITPKEDEGVHPSTEMHQKIAQLLSEKIKSLL